MLIGTLVLGLVSGNLIKTVSEEALSHHAKKLVNNMQGWSSLYYATNTGTTLEINYQAACDVYQSMEILNIQDCFYAFFFKLSKTGQKCNDQTKLGEKAIKANEFATEALERPENIKDLYQALAIKSVYCTIAECDVDYAKMMDKIIELAKKDDSVQAGSLAILSAIGIAKETEKSENPLSIDPVLEIVSIDDLLAQADSFEKQLSFDSDLAVTYFFVQAANQLSRIRGTSVLTNDQWVGLGNFAVAGAYPQSHQDIFYYILLVRTLDSLPEKLVHVKLHTNRAFDKQHKNIDVIVHDLFGKNMDVKLTGRSVTRLIDSEVVLSNIGIVMPTGKNSERQLPKKIGKGEVEYVYTYDFMKSKPKAGYYELELDIEGKNNKKLLITEDAIRFKIKVVEEPEVSDIQIGVGSKKLGAKMKYAEGKFESNEVDLNSKVGVQFKINAGGAPVKAHQAFFYLKNTQDAEVTTFIAEADANLLYSATFDVKDHLEFSGTYEVSLGVGDSLFRPGFLSIPLGEIIVSGLPEPKRTGGFNRKYLEKYDELEEKSHTFREPEPRPPVIISLIFTGACAVPLLGLLIAWRQMGINVQKLESSFIPFHVAIGSIFGLYFLYWYQLNMFTTLKFLGLLGSVTFILGNKVLSSLASSSSNSVEKK